MIYDIYGNPGAGKTYAVERIKRHTKASHAIENLKMIKVKDSLKKTLGWCPYSLRCKRQLMSLVAKNKNQQPKYIEANMRVKIKELGYLASVYKYYRGQLYLEEGIIHRLIALAVNYEWADEILIAAIDIFKESLKNAESVYLCESVEKCILSVEKRNRRKFGIDSLRGEELHRYIATFDYYTKLVHKNYGHKMVTRETIGEEWAKW